MLPLVVALTLSSSTPPALPPLPSLSRGLLSRIQHCPDTDPNFVHYVAPPEGAGPLWAIGEANAGPPFVPRRLGAAQSTNLGGLPAPPRPGCARPIPAAR
jgi:hypothetical protein